jgi:mRNA interferase MazF
MVKIVKYIPSRGDVVWLEFDPQKGNEIKKTRPAFVISPQSYNVKTGLALFMPITSQIKSYPFEVKIEIEGKPSVILCDQIRSLDWKSRKANFITSLPLTIFEKALEKFKALIHY